MMYILKSARYQAFEAYSRVLEPGDRAVDATMGNGHDTLTLCALVGENGHVDAFDVQVDAVRATEALLEKEGVRQRASLWNTGHEHMSEYVRQPVKAVLFNLGWLPGSDKVVRTRWETTLKAVDQGLKLLLPYGIMTICCYPGHEEGQEELIRIDDRLRALPKGYNVLRQDFINAAPGAPVCFVIQKQL